MVPGRIQGRGLADLSRSGGIAAGDACWPPDYPVHLAEGMTRRGRSEAWMSEAVRRRLQDSANDDDCQRAALLSEPLPR